MEKAQKNKGLSFTMIVVALILGPTLYKQFNFETYSFEKPALAALYLIVFIAAVAMLIKDFVAKKRG
ncbi:MAG: hypothetical protein EOO90_17210 [Pedobacter sp.]|nr:MAG: hypothetical protein EOO90_17210 [Pedobacter sp.]